MPLTALRTSLVTFSRSTPSWNSIEVVDTPSLTTEVMCLTEPSPATASSTRRVTWVSISVGAAPDWTTVTATTGRSTSGKLLVRSLK